MAGPSTYDVVVVGGGPTGENVAGRAVRGGLSVALVERELYGGECSYWACIPSKALLRPVEVQALARRLPGLSPGPVDTAAVLARRDSFLGGSDAGQEQWVVGTGAVPVRGHGRLAGERTVEVTAADGSVTALQARHAVVLATGTSAAVPDLPGLREARPWTSREVTTMERVPRRLVVLGGGVVAVEMAQAAKGLGAEQVVLLCRGGRLLERMEPWAGELVADGLRETGVDVRFGASASGVRRGPDGVVVTLADGAEVAGAALLADGYRGRAGLVVDDRDVLVGATFVGPDVAELLHSATVAVTAGLTLQQLWHAVPSFPTVSEGWLRLLEAAGL